MCNIVPQGYTKHPFTPPFPSPLNSDNAPAFGAISMITLSVIVPLASRPSGSLILLLEMGKWSDPGRSQTLPHSVTWAYHLCKENSAVFSGFAWVQDPGYAISQVYCPFASTADMEFPSSGLIQDINNDFSPLLLSWLCPRVQKQDKSLSKVPQRLCLGACTKPPALVYSDN